MELSDRSSRNKSEQWRFIDSGALDGRTNMAIDEALAMHIGRTQGAPVLRVYAWRPAAVSLGFHQSFDDIRIDLCQRDGIDVVMRPTGGRAVLHADELTYAVIIPENSLHYRQEISSLYEMLSRGILKALEYLDIHVRFERSATTPKNFARGELSALCYASSVQHEIGFQGKKLVGSAQRRFEGAALQHGSILIGAKHLDLADYLSRGDHKWRQAVKRYMASHTVCLNDLSATPITYRELAAAMKKGFASALNIAFTDDELSAEELSLADRLKGDFVAAVSSGGMR